LYPKNKHLHPVKWAVIADRIFADALLNRDFRNGNLMIGRDAGCAPWSKPGLDLR
jgi:hypothetical protein